MRGRATETPQVLEFARRKYYETPYIEQFQLLHIQEQLQCYVTDFRTLSPMPKPATTHQLSSNAIEEIQKWRHQYGQSVRQQTVCSMTTKDKQSTLPINVSEQEPRESDKVTMIDSFQIGKENQEISTNNSESSNTSVPGQKGDYAAVRVDMLRGNCIMSPLHSFW